ncbi:class I SAM-dependent methyltransferase [Yinghuangia sp. ASG 101]|uniref:SAM-dependent methyltransferase n=1 Tax=Yinghuangia sp. ASG 101 TaxID=2896848 RepID=UPI001E2D5B2B|nr:class I SAM-dependent methyltransferase [Yinghuangia sp. ASG 101]UGQ13121.1 class I SAM-dependent methyltransferase [Yinghuangia sp. ASG 101]
MPAIPHRLRWTVDHLDVRPGDRILEIGCGRGAAAELVCELLSDGSYLGLDRSPSAIKGAEARNARNIAGGRARFVLAPLEGTDLTASGPFDKVFAVNVNLFWTHDPAHELGVISAALAPAGLLGLSYEPPRGTPLARLDATVSARLSDNGFVVESAVDPTGSVLCVSGRRKE